MTVKSNQLVALVEWHTAGHHFTWFCMMCRSLLESGCRVAALCPNPELVKAKLKTELSAEAMARLRLVPLSFPKSPRIRPVRLRPWIQRMRFAKTFREAITQLEDAFGDQIDLVYISLIIEFEEATLNAMLNRLDRTWSGMLMQARTGPGHDQTMLASLLKKHRPRNITVIDEGFADQVATDLGVPIVVFPDFADASFVPDHPLEQRFRRFANQSPLILQIGHLRQDKGVATLSQIAVDTESRGLAFAFVGEVDWWMNESSKKHFENAIANSPRAMFHLLKLPSEEHYNAIVRSCSVMFAAYENFPHSSNSLAKAAIFEKPIIVSEGHLMADRVREFRLGEVVPYGDNEATLAAIRRITDDHPRWLAENQPRWIDYQQQHSLNALKEAFSIILKSNR